MLLVIKLARLKVDPSRLVDKPASADAVDSPTESVLTPFQSLLMLLTGADTLPEFSTTALAALTTLFCWSVLLEETGRSRTLGELLGEKMDSLDLHLETLVVFVNMPEFILNDHLITLS